MVKRILWFAEISAIFVLTAAIAFEVFGDDVLESRLYIPEAKQPESFPKPGKVGEIVVKSYPAYRAAVVTRDEANQNEMFQVLFRHIKDNNIEMTAPVEMTYDAEGENTMAFLYQASDIGELGRDGKVKVVDVPAATVVSIAVRGEYTQESFSENVAKLEQWLTENKQWKAAGPSRYFGYNSPFVPKPLRYGEVQTPIQKRS